MFAKFETPQLVLDKIRLQQNADEFLNRAQAVGVALRPHLKTSKSVDIARIATGGALSRITVSTLKEAAYFASSGYSDILYAVGIVPNKFDRVRRIKEETGQAITLVVDNLLVAKQACLFANETRTEMCFLIEIDCGEHRGGIAADAPELIEIADVLNREPFVRLLGVMTHAGHSYSSDQADVIAQIAEQERLAAVQAAERLAGAGIACSVISTGSTPTFLFGQSFEGLTEVRCGVYLFYDLAQYSRKVCRLDQIAISVLATVIGHSPNIGSITVDAGAFALSKDLSANTFAPEAGYGFVCGVDNLDRLGALRIDNVHQEHGTINIEDPIWFERLPIGSMVRILPNHACPTASAHTDYLVVEGDRCIAKWPRISGW